MKEGRRRILRNEQISKKDEGFESNDATEWRLIGETFKREEDGEKTKEGR